MQVIVSSCLLSVPCRWHGKPLRFSSYLKKWLRENNGNSIIPICPEILGGLSTPREPVKRRNGKVYITCADKSKRREVTGPDVTKSYKRGAVVALEIARQHNAEIAILCKWSPSCDITGLTGKLLTANGIEVINCF